MKLRFHRGVLSVVKSYMCKPNRGQLTVVEMEHVQTTITKLTTLAQVHDSAFRPRYKPEWSILHYAVIFAVHLFEYSPCLWRSIDSSQTRASAGILFDHGLNSVFLEQATHLNDTSDVLGWFRRYDFCLRLSCATSMRHDFTTDRVV